MEDSLSAMKFADDLVYYFSIFEGVEWKASTGVCDIADAVINPFHVDVAKAVYLIFTANWDHISTCQKEMTSEGLVTDCNNFARLALEASPLYFPHGYTPETFIAFCAMVMGVALLFDEAKDDNYLESASGVVSTVLIGYMLSGDFGKEGGWDYLVPTCSFFVEAYEALRKTSN